jgi:hypothetical protein
VCTPLGRAAEQAAISTVSYPSTLRCRGDIAILCPASALPIFSANPSCRSLVNGRAAFNALWADTGGSIATAVQETIDSASGECYVPGKNEEGWHG